MALRMSSLEKKILALSGSGYVQSGIMDLTGSGGKNASANALALAEFSVVSSSCC